MRLIQTLLLRKLIAALAMLAFVLAPVASADQAGPVADVACEIEQASGAADGHDADHTGHDHHAHGCGSCHVHLIGPQSLVLLSLGVPKSRVLPLLSANFGSPPPGDLFRPPRD